MTNPSNTSSGESDERAMAEVAYSAEGDHFRDTPLCIRDWTVYLAGWLRRAALATQPATAEPVAWMMKWPNHSPSFTTDKSDYVSWFAGRASYPEDLIPLYAAPIATPPAAPADRHLTITTDKQGRCLAVTWQDDEHRILEVVWEAPAATEAPSVQEATVKGWFAALSDARYAAKAAGNEWLVQKLAEIHVALAAPAAAVPESPADTQPKSDAEGA